MIEIYTLLQIIVVCVLLLTLAFLKHIVDYHEKRDDFLTPYDSREFENNLKKWKRARTKYEKTKAPAVSPWTGYISKSTFSNYKGKFEATTGRHWGEVKKDK